VLQRKNQEEDKRQCGALRIQRWIRTVKNLQPKKLECVPELAGEGESQKCSVNKPADLLDNEYDMEQNYSVSSPLVFAPPVDNSRMNCDFDDSLDLILEKKENSIERQNKQDSHREYVRDSIHDFFELGRAARESLPKVDKSIYSFGYSSNEARGVQIPSDKNNYEDLASKKKRSSSIKFKENTKKKEKDASTSKTEDMETSVDPKSPSGESTSSRKKLGNLEELKSKLDESIRQDGLVIDDEIKEVEKMLFGNDPCLEDGFQSSLNFRKKKEEDQREVLENGKKGGQTSLQTDFNSGYQRNHDTWVLGQYSSKEKLHEREEGKAKVVEIREDSKLGKKPSIAELKPLHESQQLSTKSKSTVQNSVKSSSSKLTLTSMELQSKNDKKKRQKVTNLEKPVEFSLEESEVMKGKSKEKLSTTSKTKGKQEITSCQLSMPVTKSGKKNYDTRTKEKPKEKQVMERKGSGQSFEEKNWSTHSKDQKHITSSPKQLSKISSSQSDAKLGSLGKNSEKVLFFERVDLSKQKEKSLTRSSHNLQLSQKLSEEAGSADEKRKRELYLAESMSSAGDGSSKPRISNKENPDTSRKPLLAQSELIASDNILQRKPGEGSSHKEKAVLPREITKERDRASQRLEEFSKGSRKSSSRSPTKVGKATAGVKKEEGMARNIGTWSGVDKGCMTDLGGEELGLKLLEFEKFRDIFKVRGGNSRRWRRTTRRGPC
jgi:hypothetical protein